MLAIIIPYYKLEYFEDCLQSLAKQTNKNFKVYIGDDASSQDPLKIIEKFKDSLDLVYHRFNENLGGTSLTRQWHRCINLSQGERWLMILGDDDYISENYVDEFYSHLKEIEKLDIKVVRFASRIVRSPSGECSKLYTHPKIEKSTDFVFRRYFKGSRCSLTEQIFRRDMFLKYGFSNIALGWGSDIFAWMQMSEFGDNLAINTATSYFRISDLNISRGGYKEENKLQARIEFFSKYLLPNLKKFRPIQRIKFILLFEQIVYKANQLTFKNWQKISYFLIENKYILHFIKFNRRVLIHLFENRRSYSISIFIKSIITEIKFKLYRVSRAIPRLVEGWQKTEFEKRIWNRQQILFGTEFKKELSDFKLYQTDHFKVWKNSFAWQRRLENKLNAKEFALKAGIKVAKKIWSGRKEDFQTINLSILPETFTIKPVRGEASKNIFLMNSGYNLFDRKNYSGTELRSAVSDLYLKKDISEIIIEEFLPNEDGEILVPNDYRFYTFNGNILFIQLDKRKSFEKDSVSFYDENWNLIRKKVLVDAVVDNFEPAPNCLPEMIKEVKKLSRHYETFVRIDFYATNRGAVFGEFTPTPRKGKFLTKYGNENLIIAWDKYCKRMI